MQMTSDGNDQQRRNLLRAVYKSSNSHTVMRQENALPAVPKATLPAAGQRHQVAEKMHFIYAIAAGRSTEQRSKSIGAPPQPRAQRRRSRHSPANFSTMLFPPGEPGETPATEDWAAKPAMTARTSSEQPAL